MRILFGIGKSISVAFRSAKVAFFRGAKGNYAALVVSPILGILSMAVSFCGLFPSASPAAGLPISNRIRSACEPLDYGSLRMEGCLGRRIADNVRQELLVFPLETYLSPYAHGGKPNGNWGVDEFVAKYLQTMTIAYQSEPAAVRASLKQRMDRIKDAWLAYQKPDGFCVTRKDWDKPEWDGAWDTWNARYLLLGMLKYYESFHDAKVLDAAKRLADSFIAGHGPGKRKLDKFGGVMLESMVLLYRTTGDARYLDNCHWMMQSKMRHDYVDELVARSGRVDRIPDCHAYVVTSCLAGILDLYQLEGGPKEYLDACRIAINDIVKNRWYITGGMGEVEHFRDNGILSGTIPDLPQEACEAAYFMALCRKLFWLTGDPRYVDYLETSLYNNGLGSKNPRDSFLVSYYSPLQGRKTWLHTDHTNGTPCCTCSMCREIARIPEDFAARWNDDGLCLLLYNPGSLHCPVKAADGQPAEVALKVAGDWPAGGRVKLSLRPSRPASFRLSLRVPAWCHSFRAAVHGQAPLAGTPGTFLHIDRQWSADDRVDVEMDMPLRILQGGESYPNCVALRRGPQVLAVDNRVNPSLKGLDDLRIETGEARGTGCGTAQPPARRLGRHAGLLDALPERRQSAPGALCRRRPDVGRRPLRHVDPHRRRLADRGRPGVALPGQRLEDRPSARRPLRRLGALYDPAGRLGRVHVYGHRRGTLRIRHRRRVLEGPRALPYGRLPERRAAGQGRLRRAAHAAAVVRENRPAAGELHAQGRLHRRPGDRRLSAVRGPSAMNECRLAANSDYPCFRRADFSPPLSLST